MRPYHSSRLPTDLTADLLTDAALPHGVVDLTQSNPTQCALGQQVALSVAAAEGARYLPEPLGPRRGREAVAACLSGWGRATHSDQVMLTSSTSEALSFIFKLTCSPHERVACGVPGYPLVPHLAELEGLAVDTFQLHQGADGLWQLDVASVQRVLQQGAAAVVLVSPGNPTGSYLSPTSTQALADLCNRHGALAIFDEVFAPYHKEAPHARLVDVSAFDRAICVGGLSKAALLPQAKISWLAVHGTAAFRAAALAGLTWIGDAYLSVGITALALPEMLAAMAPVQAALRQRIARNDASLRQLWQHHGGATLDPYTAGWYAVLRPGPEAVRAQAPGRHLADSLLATAAVQLQPGYLFDLPGAHTLVASLMVPEALHRAGWQRVAEQLRP